MSTKSATEVEAHTTDLSVLTAPFPAAAIKQRQGGGGRMLDYVEGHSVINRLNAATGNHWDFMVDRFDIQDGLAIAFVTLSLPGLGTRQHIGVQKVSTGGGEDMVKGCVTDALKKAATLFGVGIELYGVDYETGTDNTPQHSGNGGQYHQPQQYQDRPASNGNSGSLTDVPGSLSEKQGKMIFAVSRKLGMDDAKVKASIQRAYGVEHVDDLSKAQATKFIDFLKKKEAEMEQPQASDDEHPYGDPFADTPDAVPHLM
jgi:hypothetical protein